MARLGQYKGTDQLGQVRVPQAQVSSAVGDAMQRAGGQIANAGFALAEHYQKKQDELDTFKTNLAVRDFSSRQNQANLDALQNMKPGAEGFHDARMKAFNEEAEKLRASIPESKQQDFDLKVSGLREKFSFGAAKSELTERNRFFKDETDKTLEGLAVGIKQNPATHKDALSYGEEFINSSGMSAIDKEATRDAWKRMANLAYFDTLPSDQKQSILSRMGFGGADIQEGNLGGYLDALMMSESGGNANAKNPGKGQTATGHFQFIEGTWKGLMQRYPELGLTANGRTDPVQSRKAAIAFTQDNIKTLKAAGVPITRGNLYIAHMVPGLAAKVIKSPDSAKMTEVFSSEIIKANAGMKHRASGTKLANMTVGQFKQEMARRVGGNTVMGAVEQQSGLARISYANKGAIRNKPITPTLTGHLQTAVSAVYGPGYRVEVYSGGQDDERRTGSHRHDAGKAADVYIYGPDGKKVTGDRLAPLGQYWAAKKIGGVGLEMNGGGVHLDEHATPPHGGGMHWNYANQGGTYTPAMQKAMEAGLRGELPQLAGPDGNHSTQSLTPEERELVSSFSYDDVSKLQKQLAKDMATADKQRSAAMAQQADEVGLQIVTDPSSITEQDILDNEMLTVSSQTSLIKSLRTEMKKQGEKIDAATWFNGDERANPLDSDERKRADLVFEGMMEGNGQITEQIAGEAIVKEKGIVPKSYANHIRNALNSTNAADLANGAQLAYRVQQSDMQALRGVENSGDLMDAATKYGYFRNEVGLSHDQVGQKLLSLADPEARALREALLKSPTVKDKLKDVDRSFVESQMSKGSGNIFDYSLGINDAAGDAMTARYRAMYQEAIVEANGDFDLAAELTTKRFQRSYGPSQFIPQGDDVIVPYPPEKAYQPTPDGKHDYIADQLKEALTEEVGEYEKAFLLPLGTETEKAAKAGFKVPYLVQYVKDGKEVILPYPFYADYQAGLEAFKRDPERSASAYVEQVKRPNFEVPSDQPEGAEMLGAEFGRNLQSRDEEMRKATKAYRGE